MPDDTGGLAEAIAAYNAAIRAYRETFGPIVTLDPTGDSTMPDTVTTESAQPPDATESAVPQFSRDDLFLCCGMWAIRPAGVHVLSGHYSIDEALRTANLNYAHLVGNNSFDADGYDSEGFDTHGYDRDGYDEDGYDSEGFDREGLDSDGYTRDGEYLGRNGRDGSGLIRDWNATPFDGWTLRGAGRVFMGAEIEVESRGSRFGDGARLVNDCLSCPDNGPDYYGVVKHDGSLSNGFEIATQPMEYGWAVDNFPWHMLTELRDMGFRSTSNCGLHIHVNRDAFDSSQHVYRWLKFIYRNPEAIQALARRGSTGYSQWDDYARQSAKDHAKGDRSADRYLAVNVQNDETFEVRLFRSSLRPQAVQAAFGFVEASVEYTRTLTTRGIVQAQGWAWAAFLAYVQDHGDRWAPLLAEVAERNIPADQQESVMPADMSSHGFLNADYRRRVQRWISLYGYAPDEYDRRSRTFQTL